MSKQLVKIFTYVDGVNDTPFPNEENQLIIPEYSFSDIRMGSVNLTATAMYPTCLDDKWVTGKQYADFRGERYFIVKTPSSSKSNDDVRYKHDIEFVSERNILETIYFYDVVSDNTSVDRYVSNSTKVLFYGDVHELVARLNYSLEYSQVSYRVVVDAGITSEVKQVSLEDVFVFDAIQEIFNIFELPFYFVGKTCHVGFTDNAITHTFRYGKDYELLSINKTNANYKITNRVTGTGSSDNIQFYYPNPSNDRAAIEAAGGKWITPAGTLMPPIYRDTDGAERFYNAINKRYINPETGEYYVFENEFTTANQKEQIVTFEDIKPTIKNTLNAAGLRIDEIIDVAFDKDDNDEVDESTGDYVHSYFYVKLNRFSGDYGFNLFEQPIVGSDASIVMTSGNCNACTFQIGVIEVEEDGKTVFKNPVQVDKNGNIAEGNYADKVKPNNIQANQQDTTQNEVWIALKKDNTTFGMVMPNKNGNIRPSYGDSFVITNIDMPQTYIYKAENELEEAILKYMANNNSEKFTFSIKLSRIFLAENPAIEALINSSARIDLEYNGKYHQLYVSSYTYRSDSEVLPEITIELADTLTISKNSIQTSIDSVKQDIMNTIGGVDFLKQGLKYFLRKDTEDIARFFISFLRGIKIGNYVSGGDIGGIFAVDGNGKTFIETDFLKVRMKAYFETLEIINTGSIAGRQIITPGGSIKCIKVVDREEIINEDGEKEEKVWNFYRCYFLAEQDGVKVENRFRKNDQALSQDFNIKEGVYENVSNHYYWRLVVGVGDDYIDLSKTDADTKSDAPAIGDVICQLGHRDDKVPERQNAMIFSAVDLYSPSLTMYAGINSYSYVNKDYISYGVDKTTNKAFMNVYGDTYIGDRNRTSYMEFKTGKGLKIKGQLEVGSTIGNGSTIEDALDKATQDAIDAATEDLTNYAKEVTESLNNIQYQIDGQIESFFEKYSPTLTNKPAVDWTTEELKKQHANDTFTNIDTGESWKWVKDGTTWKWSVIEDTATLKALAAASKAQDTADGKRRVFVVKPTTEQAYDVGDLWVNATYGTTYHNDILRAKTAKKAGEAFNISHWELASKYTDDTKANEAAEAAAAAQEAAEQAATAVDNLNTYVDGAFKDGVIEESEAQAIEKYINIVDNAKKTTDAAYTKLYANTYLTGAAKTGLKSAKDKLDIATTNLINSINTAIADGQTTVAEKNDVDAKFAAYNTANEAFSTAVEVANGAIQDLLKSYSDQAKEAAVAAQAAADAAQAAADSASDAVDDLNGYVDGAFKDGIIDASEAQAIEKYINIVNNTKGEVKATFDKLYANVYLTGAAKTGLNSSYTALNTAITNLLNSINTAIADGKTTASEKADVDLKYASFNTAYASFNTAVETANKAIQDKLKTFADDAKALAESAQAVADAAKDRLDSWAEDGVISPTEKQGIKDEIARIKADKDNISAGYELYNLGEATAYNTAYTDYYNSLLVLSDTTKETIEIPTDFATKQTKYYTERTAALNAIASASKSAVDAAQAAADAAKSRLDSWAADGVISPAEKQSIKDERARILADKADITTGYTRYNLGTPTDYNTAYTAYDTALAALSKDTPEVITIPSDFATKQKNYYTKRTAAISAIDAATKSNADAAAAAAAKAQEDIDNVKTDINKINSDVAGLKNFTDDAFADGVVDRGEASAIGAYLKSIATVKADVDKSYTEVYANPLLAGTAKTTLNTTYTAFEKAVEALTTVIEAVVEKGIADATDRASVNGKYDAFNTKYGDFVKSLNAANTYIQDQIESKAQSALDEAISYRYLSRAFDEYTTINGGLIQNSLNVLGYTNDKKEFVVQAGMSGLYDASARGGGIAAWYGGSMKDYFDYTDLDRPKDVAKGVDRMDGTGYRANGNLWWDLNGKVHADPLSFFVGKETVGGLLASFQVVMTNDKPDYIIPQVPFQDLTISNNLTVGGDIILKDGILKWDAANNAFYVEKKDGSIASFYATGEVSAGGAGSGGSGGGGGLIENVYGSSSLGDEFSDSDLNNTFNAYSINQIYLDVKNLKDGAAVSLVVNGTGTVLTNIVKTGSTITATKGNLAFSSLTSKPTTIAGYGITDAYTKTQADGKYVLKSGSNMTGALNWTDADSGVYAMLLGTNHYIGIDGTSGSSMLHWDGIRTHVGSLNGSVAIRSNATDLIHNYNGTGYIILDARNYNRYAPTKTGTGASGTWGINVNGYAHWLYPALGNKTAEQVFTGNGVYYYQVSSDEDTGYPTDYGHGLMLQRSSGDTLTSSQAVLDIFTPTSSANLVYLRTGIGNGTKITWQAFQQILHTGNYTSLITKLGTATVGSTVKPFYLNAGVPTAFTTTVGSASLPVYMNAGSITACSTTLGVSITGNAATATKLGTATVGSNTKFFYLNAGTPTASNASIGTGTQPIYLNGGVFTASTSTVGSASRGIYMTGGLLTAMSATVGSASLPVYMNAGTITQCSTTLGVSITGTAPRLTTTELTNQDLNSYTYTNYSGKLYYAGGGNTTTNVPSQVGAYGLMVLRNASGYTAQLMISSAGNWYSRTHNGTAWDAWNQLAHITDNVASATKLQTARTLWGQSFNGTANITGTLLGVESLVARSGRINNFLGYLDNSGNPATGTICITLPNGWTSSMNIYEILIYEYNTTANASVITIGGYNYNGGGTASSAKWINIGYHTKGAYSKGVRLAYNGSKCVILLGTTATTWYYPKVYLKTIYTGHSNQTIWGGTSTISLITSETGYTNIEAVGRMDEFFGDTSVTGGLAVTGAGHFGYTHTSMTTGINVKGDSATTGICLYDGSGTTAHLYRKGDILYITRAGNDANGILMSVAGSIYPGANNTLTNGTTTNRWSNVCTQLLNVAGVGTFASHIAVSGEVRSTSAKAFRAVYGSYGFFIYNDGNSTYFMLTAKDDRYGTYNSLRPLYINNSTGVVSSATGIVSGGVLNVSNTTDATATTVAAIKTAGGIGVAKQLRVGGAVTFGSTLSVTGQITASGGLRIGNYYLKSTADGLALTHVTTGTVANFYATGEVSAGGVGSGGSGGGGGLIENVYGYSKLDGEYKDTDLNNTFNAYTIAQINKRVVSLEGGSALTVTTTGSGNAVTSVAKSGTAITVTKGTTFVDITNTQTIGGTKTFSSSIRMGQNSLHYLNDASANNTTGLYWKTASYAATQFGIGCFTTKNASPRAFIGWTSEPWTTSNNLTVSETQLTYKAKNILHAGNYNDYAPTKTGGGASGSWGISITGNAATATTATKLGTATIGAANKPIYLNAGTPTALSSTVGDSVVPAYLNAGTVTACSWGLIGTTGKRVRKSGYITSSTSGLSSYWGKMASFDWGETSDERDITLYVHSGYNVIYGIVLIRVRWSSATNTIVTLKILNGNIPKSRLRLYYDVSAKTNVLTLWGDVAGQWGVFNTYLLSETTRTSVETSGVTLYSTSFSTAQTLPTSTYIQATYLGTLGHVALSDVADKLGTSTVGSGVKPIYLNAGTATASTSTVGAANKGVYMSSGTITAMSSTVGSTTVPVYMNAGAITVCSTTLGVSITGNAKTATTLQTTRNIFGQPFSGAGNVAGQATVYGTYQETAISRYSHGGIQVRENDLVADKQTADGYAPAIGFHWASRSAASLIYTTSGFKFMNQAFTGYANVYATLKGNADSATQVYNTQSNPTSGTWYAGTFITDSTTGNKYIRSNNGFAYYSLEGTASAQGEALIQIGNTTATGTAGNKRGRLRLCSSSSGYTDFVLTATTGTRTLTLPDATGTVALTSSNVASATKLQTARTLWGQSFDGTANVSGSLTGVGNITASAGINIISTGENNISFLRGGSDATAVVLNATAFKPYDAATNKLNLGTSAARWLGLYANIGNFSSAVTGTRFISTVATGTAPLTVSSTTVVTNLNADMVDGIHSSNIPLEYDASYKPTGTAARWIRIAYFDYSSANYSWSGTFAITNSYVNNENKGLIFNVSTAHGTTSPVITQIGGSGGVFTSIRIVKDTTTEYPTTAKVYLEVYYNSTSANNYVYVSYKPANRAIGKWTLYTTYTAGSIPTGHTAIAQLHTTSGLSTTANLRVQSEAVILGSTNHNSRLTIQSDGKIVPYSTATRRSGVYGVYDSAKIGHIWSMGTNYMIADDGSGFGTLYGFAYQYSSSLRATGHQAVWCVNGNPRVAIGDNFWVANAATIGGTLSVTGAGSVNTLTIKNTEGVGHIKFSRGSFNYITAPTSGTIAFIVNGQAVGEATADLIIQNGVLKAGAANATALGQDTRRWSNMYSVLLNVSGVATLSSTVNIAGVLNANNATDATSTTAAGAVFDGGVGIVKQLRVGGNVTIGGNVTFATSGLLSVPYSGGPWISLATRTNLIAGNQNTSEASAHALYRVKSFAGDAIVFGGLKNSIGFYGFYKARIDSGDNNYDWRTVWDSTTGKLLHSKAFEVSGATTLNSTLTVASTGLFNLSTDATSTTAAAVRIVGGLAVGKQLRVGGAVTLSSTLSVSSTLNVSGVVNANNATDATSTTAASLVCDGGVGIVKQLRVGGATTLSSTLSVAGIVSFTNATDATSTTAAAVKVTGGLGVAKQLRVGSNAVFTKGIYINGNTTGDESITLGVSGDKKIKMGAGGTAGNRWSEIAFFPNFANNGEFTDINLNIQAEGTIQISSQAKLIWISGGNIAASGEVSAGSTSDRNLKKNFSLEDYQQRVLDLGMVQDFEYREEEMKRAVRTYKPGRHTSLIAQDIKSCTSMVSKDKDGYLKINPLDKEFLFTVVGAVQLNVLGLREVKSEVEILKDEIRELKKRIEYLESLK